MLPEVALDPLGLDLDGVSVVAIGGGHGLAQVLEAVLGYAGKIAAVVTVADDGGSSGRLTSVMDIPPPGDIRKCLLALSPEPSVWRELFAYRFEQGDVAGHSLGNLMLAALQSIVGGDFTAAVRLAGSLLGSRGEVLPAAERSLHLRALIDGRWVEGQAAITKSIGTVEALELEPSDVDPNPDALAAIAGADQIVIAPGSLYTSVISALLVPGIAEVVNQAPGRLIVVGNLATQDGETVGMTGPDHIAALQIHGGLQRAGTIVAHKGDITVPAPLQPLRFDGVSGWDVVTADLLDTTAAWPQHDPFKLGALLRDLKG